MLLAVGANLDLAGALDPAFTANGACAITEIPPAFDHILTTGDFFAISTGVTFRPGTPVVGATTHPADACFPGHACLLPEPPTTNP